MLTIHRPEHVLDDVIQPNVSLQLQGSNQRDLPLCTPYFPVGQMISCASMLRDLPHSHGEAFIKLDRL